MNISVVSFEIVLKSFSMLRMYVCPTSGCCEPKLSHHEGQHVHQNLPRGSSCTIVDCLPQITDLAPLLNALGLHLCRLDNLENKGSTLKKCEVIVIYCKLFGRGELIVAQWCMEYNPSAQEE